MSYKPTPSTPTVYTSAPPAYDEDHQPLISSSSHPVDVERNYDNKTVNQSSIMVRMGKPRCLVVSETKGKRNARMV